MWKMYRNILTNLNQVKSRNFTTRMHKYDRRGRIFISDFWQPGDVWVHSSPVYYKDKNIVTGILVVTDITWRKESSEPIISYFLLYDRNKRYEKQISTSSLLHFNTEDWVHLENINEVKGGLKFEI